MSQSSLQLLWDIYHLSPGVGPHPDDLLWDNDKGEQSYSPLHPVCGGTVGSGPLGAVTCRKNAVKHERWMHQGIHYLVLLKAFIVKINQHIGMSASFRIAGCCPHDFTWVKCTRQGKPMCISHITPISFVQNLHPTTWSLGQVLQLLAS